MDIEKGILLEESAHILGDDAKPEHDSVAAAAHTTVIQSQAAGGTNWRLWWSTIINTTSTVTLVFVNKQIFRQLHGAQVSFAAFHFAATAAVLFLLSRPRVGLFEAKYLDFMHMLPLSLSMITNIILQNAALAYCSIQFSQVTRVLLTPACAFLNYVLFRITIPVGALYTLIPICAGVGLVTYSNARPGSTSPSETSPVGVVLALSAVCVSALYMVWSKPYHKKLACDSWQLMLNQSAISVVLMLYIIPFADDLGFWRTLDTQTWWLIAFSGILAFMVNVSQLIILDEAGAITGTVVGHLKTCSIILLGWMTSHEAVADISIVGFLLAIAGIITYSRVMIKSASDRK